MGVTEPILDVFRAPALHSPGGRPRVEQYADGEKGLRSRKLEGDAGEQKKTKTLRKNDFEAVRHPISPSGNQQKSLVPNPTVGKTVGNMSPALSMLYRIVLSKTVRLRIGKVPRFLICTGRQLNLQRLATASQQPDNRPPSNSHCGSTSIAMNFEPVLDPASVVLRRYGDRPTHPIWHRCERYANN